MKKINKSIKFSINTNQFIDRFNIEAKKRRKILDRDISNVVMIPGTGSPLNFTLNT